LQFQNGTGVSGSTTLFRNAYIYYSIKKAQPRLNNEQASFTNFAWTLIINPSMRKNIFILLLLCMQALTMTAANHSVDYNVIPLPQEVSFTSKAPFVLNASTVVVATGDEKMKANARFLADYIKEMTGIGVQMAEQKTKSSIRLVLDKKIANSEGYTIKVTDKEVLIAGKTPQGVFYGVQTLRKALPVEQNLTQVELPSVVIKDAPRFSYRGMMLDCSRHFLPLSFVKRYIDLIALHNMNTFHWHLTDDQGWRIEIKQYPKLTEIGSKRAETVLGRISDVYDGKPYGGFYTQEEAREIVKYAAERYITVIPEIDMPGHMQAALAGYPELGCTGGPYEVRKIWGVSDEVLCLGNEKTYEFCQNVLDELMQIFPSEIIHIGGDEAPQRRWKACPRCKAKMAELGIDSKKIQGYFTNRIEKFVNSKGRRILGWDEILDGDINQSAMVMSWRGLEPGIKAAHKGHNVIMSPVDYAYFDYYQVKDNWKEPQSIGGNLPIEKVYSYEPLPDSINAEVQKHILGVQANLWTEYIETPNHAEYMVLPRMSALADVQWSHGKKDFEAFKKRLTRFTNIYELYHYYYGKHLWPERHERENAAE